LSIAYLRSVLILVGLDSVDTDFVPSLKFIDIRIILVLIGILIGRNSDKIGCGLRKDVCYGIMCLVFAVIF
jgi:hypothetical protein